MKVEWDFDCKKKDSYLCRALVICAGFLCMSVETEGQIQRKEFKRDRQRTNRSNKVHMIAK